MLLTITTNLSVQLRGAASYRLKSALATSICLDVTYGGTHGLIPCVFDIRRASKHYSKIYHVMTENECGYEHDFEVGPQRSGYLLATESVQC